MSKRRKSKRRALLLRARNYAESLVGQVRHWMLPSHRFDTADFARIVTEALDEMQPRCKELQIMHRHSGMTVPEIATALGIKPETVTSLLQRGNRILRRRLTKAGYSPEGRRVAAQMREIA